MRRLVIMLAIVMLTGCATMQPVEKQEPVDLSTIIKPTGYGLSQLQEDGTYKLIPVYFSTKTGVLFAPIKGAPWMPKPDEPKQD